LRHCQANINQRDNKGRRNQTTSKQCKQNSSQVGRFLDTLQGHGSLPKRKNVFVMFCALRGQLLASGLGLLKFSSPARLEGSRPCFLSKCNSARTTSHPLLSFQQNGQEIKPRRPPEFTPGTFVQQWSSRPSPLNASLSTVPGIVPDVLPTRKTHTQSQAWRLSLQGLRRRIVEKEKTMPAEKS
jgi:hypothetical protein